MIATAIKNTHDPCLQGSRKPFLRISALKGIVIAPFPVPIRSHCPFTFMMKFEQKTLARKDFVLRL